MKAPFFSILLPTKNRSEIVGDAIQSALRQTFKDFELVISDNDDSDTATRQAVAKIRDDRIRYFRTNGGLPMHENWENAFNQATGEYVLILEDKQRLVPNALEILHHHIQANGPIPISYDIKFDRGEFDPEKSVLTRIPSVQRWRSVDAIELFCRFEQKFFNLLPKGLDSCAPRRLLQQIQAASPTGMFFSYTSPDYASGFLLLSTVSEFLYMSEPLVSIPNNWMWAGRYSNGQASYRKTDSYKKFLESLKREVRLEDILNPVPIKSEFLWINWVLYDFRTFYKRPDHNPAIKWSSYYGFCLYLIQIVGRKLQARTGLREELELLKSALRREPLRVRAGARWDFCRRFLLAAGRTIKDRVLRK